MASNYDSAMESFEDDKSPKEHNKDSNRLRSRITDAKKVRESGDWDAKWSKLIKIYSNKYPYDELKSYEDKVVPNMIFSSVNIIVPSIAIHAPKIEVTATQEEDAAQAEVVQAVVNHQWDCYDVQNEVRDAVKDFVIVGHGWVKVTWETEESEVDLDQDEYALAVQEALSGKMNAGPENADMFPEDDEIIASVETKKKVLTKDNPLVRRVSPFDIFVDPDAKCKKDMRWIAHRLFEPIEVVRKNEDYDPVVRARVPKVAKSKARDKVEVEDDSDQSNEQGFAEIWEYYDLINGTVCVFAEGCQGYLKKPEPSVFLNKNPFVFVPNFEVPERFYPIGDVETIFPLQLELAMTRTAQVNDRKRGRRITLFRENALGNQGVEDLRAGRDNVMIPVLNDLPFADVFQQVSSLGLQPEWYQASDRAMQDMDLISGIPDYVRGGAADIRRTATEVGAISDAANARQSDKLFKVEQAMAEVAEHMIFLSQNFMDGEKVARVVTDTMAVNWVPYSKDDIQGEYKFQVAAGSTQPVNESLKRQQAGQLMDSMGQFVGSGLLNDQYFLTQILKLNGFNNVEMFLGPGLPPPMPPEAPAPAQEAPLPPDPSMMPPGAPPMGMPPGAMPPGAEAGLPPTLPPELLAALMAQMGGQPPMAGGPPVM